MFSPIFPFSEVGCNTGLCAPRLQYALHVLYLARVFVRLSSKKSTLAYSRLLYIWRTDDDQQDENGKNNSYRLKFLFRSARISSLPPMRDGTLLLYNTSLQSNNNKKAGTNRKIRNFYTELYVGSLWKWTILHMWCYSNCPFTPNLTQVRSAMPGKFCTHSLASFPGQLIHINNIKTSKS